MSGANVLRVGEADCLLSPLRLSHIEALIAQQQKLEGEPHEQFEFALMAIQFSASIRHPDITIDALRVALDLQTTIATFHKIMAMSRADFDAVAASARLPNAAQDRRRRVGRVSSPRHRR